MLKGTIPTRGTNEFAIFRLVNTCALIEALKTFRSINFFMSKNIKPYSSCRLLGVFKCPTSEKLFKEGFYSLLTERPIRLAQKDWRLPMTGAAGHEAKPCCFELKALLQHPKCIYKVLMTKRRRLRNRMILSNTSEL